jgi:hypothetical protein
MILSLLVNDQSDQVGSLSVQVTPFAIRVSGVSGGPQERFGFAMAEGSSQAVVTIE